MPRMAALEDAMSTVEAAAYIGMHPSTLANWRLAGVGPKYVSLGSDKNKRGKVRYRKRDLEEWLESRVRETA
jgi:predicted DNA-binding transcriptional regulator AlpA